MSTTVQPVLTDREGAVLTLTLNRPEKLNALTDGVLAGLRDGLAEARDDEGIRAVVITGAGRGFCAGQDLTVNAENPALDVEHHLAGSYHPVITAIREIDKPVVAAVNGVAAGAGLSLALACDLRLAARSASFIQAFVRIGLVPDAGGTFFLPRLVGLARAMELSMLGDTIRADDAARFGLVNRVVDDAALAGETAELAARLARGPRSVGLIKRVLNQSLQNDLAAQLRVEAQTQALAASTEDFREGVMAFVQRRPAEFKGR